MTLVELAREEDMLRDLVAQAAGTIEAKARYLQHSGVFDAYRDVHRKYVLHAQGGDVEALRRAAFIQWLAAIEPPFLSGLCDLDSAAQRALLTLLEEAVAAEQLDDELAWMLPYYYQMAEWWIPDSAAPRLIRFCRSRAPRQAVRPPPGFAYIGRGEMGRYWASMRGAAG